MNLIKNPILSGFNPDPSIVRVGDDYYIATSTFEWYPGVQIHHSRDLKNWRLIARPLQRVSQLNMVGTPSSGGVWAPCLSYVDGIFYLIYTDVKTRKGIFKDTHNYLITSNDICGDWSDPIYLNSSGFDPSLFHDDKEGGSKKWLLNMNWDHRRGRNPFAGIVMQEYCPTGKRLVGEIKNIFKGTNIGVTEGPHLYKFNGYYYLITAEGGTGTDHSVTMARSKTIHGPYEVDPKNPVLTSRLNPENPIQKAGHADLVETQNGEIYMVHLMSRPIPSNGRSPLGRETGIQKMKWTTDGWLRLEGGGNSPFSVVAPPKIEECKFTCEESRDEFDKPNLNINLQTLRIPLDERLLSLSERPGFLRLKGAESLSSKHTQCLVARRQQAFSYVASTCLEFNPNSFKQMAGLICFYDIGNYYYLFVSHDEELGKCLDILTNNNGTFGHPLRKPIPIEGVNRIYLKASVEYDRLQFLYSIDNKKWVLIGPILDSSTLSDEYTNEGQFTGAFVGMCCQDLQGTRNEADFDYFEYIEN